MKTSTIALLVVVAVLVMHSNGSSSSSRQPTFTPAQEPRQASNPGGDTFTTIMGVIKSTEDLIRTSIDASSERGTPTP